MPYSRSVCWCLLLLVCFVGLSCRQVNAQLQVSSNHRYLQDKQGKPFFWMGDTAWELLHRLTREEIMDYLQTRQRQGFNVIQIFALPFAQQADGKKPNRYGDFPFVATNPAQPAVTSGNNPILSDEYDYWDHADFVIKTAAQKGLYIALSPVWGDYVAHQGNAHGVLFNQQNAYAYGHFLGNRYANQPNIIWILGGDFPPVYDTNAHQHYDDRPIWRALAAGLKAGEGTHRHLMSYHPKGAASSSQWLHQESWLDFNAFQSGHGSREADAWRQVTQDLALAPPKPVLDMEPCYEDHPVNPWDGQWTRQRGYFRAYDVRARIYRGVFAGMCGFTYGHHQVWQFVDTSRYTPITVGDTIIGWQQALHAPAADQIRYLKALLLSRPYFSRLPDQTLVLSDAGSGYRDLIVATRDSAGSYAMLYLPQSRPVTIDMRKVSGQVKTAWWYNPRTGAVSKDTRKLDKDAIVFTPPVSGTQPIAVDWVLVIDDAAKQHRYPVNEIGKK